MLPNLLNSNDFNIKKKNFQLVFLISLNLSQVQENAPPFPEILWFRSLYSQSKNLIFPRPAAACGGHRNHGGEVIQSLQVFVAPSVNSRQYHFCTTTILPIFPVANNLLYRPLAATFKDAKCVRCPTIAELDLKSSRGGKTWSTENKPNVVLPLTSLRTSLERRWEFRCTQP